MKLSLSNFTSNESGATLVEYGVALLVAIIVGGVGLTNLGNSSITSMNAAGSILPNCDDAPDPDCADGNG